MSRGTVEPVRTVLVTGAAGYVGSVAVRRFLGAGMRVIGLDRLLFGSHGLDGLWDHPGFRFVHGDVRRHDDWSDALDAADAVLHLAAVVGDPACAAQPGAAASVNVEATWRLFTEALKRRRPQRFLFASTCSNYGRHPHSDYCDENSELRPQSLYARTKVEIEQRILAASTGDALVPTCLRFATAFGLSPRMRFDLTVNEFTRELVEGRTLEVYGEQFWRPYCHTEDIAEACLTALQAAPETVSHQAFNVGSTHNNHTKAQIVELLRCHLPEVRVEFVERTDDPRSYKVKCDRIERALGFRARHGVEAGILQIMDALAEARFADLPERALRNVAA